MDCSEKGVTSPDQLMTALKRYLEQCGKTEQAVASQLGVNRHTLARWLSDKESPKKGKLALTAFFLRRAGYLTAAKNIQTVVTNPFPPEIGKTVARRILSTQRLHPSTRVP